MTFYLTANSIVNLSASSTYDNLQEKIWQKYVEKNISKPLLLQPLDGTDTILNHIKDKNSVNKAVYIDCCKHIIPAVNDDTELKLARIYSYVLQVFVFKKGEINRWKRMSEADIYDTFWSPVLNIIFEDSEVILTRGETENTSTKGLLEQGPDERGAFKVDLRAILESATDNNPPIIKQFDIANCEVAKSGKVEKKNVTDNAKIIIEGKVILDSITRKCAFRFKEARKIKVVNLQLSGSKGILVQIKYAKDQNGYVSQTIGETIRFPSSPKYIKDFFETGIPYLFYWKNRAQFNLNLLQHGMNEDDSDFGESGSASIEQSFIKPTWIGPKNLPL